MKRFKNAGIAALSFLLSASITFGVISPVVEKQVLAYGHSEVLTGEDLQDAQDDFAAYQEAKITELSDYVAGYGSTDRASDSLDQAILSIRGYNYDTNSSYDDNLSSFDSYVSSLKAQIDVAIAMDSFDAYKNDTISQVYAEVNRQYPGTASERVSDYLTPEIVNIADYPYDENRSLDENRSSFDSYMQGVWLELNTLFDMDSFDAYKTETVSQIYSAVNQRYPNGSVPGNVSDYLTTEVPLVQDYPYDENRSLTENLSSFDSFMSGVWIELSQNCDIDSFYVYKTEALNQIYSAISQRYPGGASERVDDYIYDEAVLIMDYPYDEYRSFTENQASFDSYMQGVWLELNTLFDMDSFDAYKNETLNQVYSAINQRYPSGASERVDDYIYNEAVLIIDYPYDDLRSFNENRDSYDRFMQGVWLELNTLFDMDSFDAYKNDTLNQVYSAISQRYPSGVSERVDDYIYDEAVLILDYPFDEYRSFNENRDSYDRFMQDVWIELNTLFDMDSFDAYKAETVDELRSYVDNHPSYRVVFYMDSVIDTISDYPYSENKSLMENIDSFDVYIHDIYVNVDLRSDMDEFDAYRDNLVNDLNDSGSSAYEDAADMISVMGYNVDLSLEDNKTALNTVVATASVAASEEIEDVVFPTVNLETYTLLDGQDSEWTVGDEDGLTLRCEGGIDSFRGIILDGALVDPSLYTTYEGSTYCVLSEELLSSIATGDHNLVFVYTDGISEVTRFTTTAVNDTTASAVSETATTTSSAAATTTEQTTTATVLGESRTDAEAATEADPATTEAVNTVAAPAPAETSAPAVQPAAAAAATSAAAASTGEAANNTALIGTLLIASAAVMFLAMRKKIMTGKN